MIPKVARNTFQIPATWQRGIVRFPGTCLTLERAFMTRRKPTEFQHVAHSSFRAKVRKQSDGKERRAHFTPMAIFEEVDGALRI